MDNIYIVRGAEQAGPFTESEIRAQLASGTLSSDTLVWWEGLPEWTALSNTPLGSAVTPAALPTPSGALPTPAAPAPAPEFAAAEVVPGTTRTSALAITSLATGIIGFPTILCWPIALLLALAAIITGHIARSQIKKDPSQSGKGLALAGLICGYIGIVLIIAVVVFSVLIALGSQTKSIFETIQSQLNAATNHAPVTPNP